MASEFNNDATNQRRQLDLIQQQIREQQLQQLQQQQMMRMQASMARMTQMQQQLAAQVASSQAQMAVGGGIPGYGSSAAAVAAGVQGMSFGGLVSQGFIGPMVNQLSGGALFPDINYSPAFGRARMEQELRGELSRRFSYAGSSIGAAIVPYMIRRRIGMAFAGGEFMRDTERGLQASFEYLRGADALATGGARADLMGVRIDSAFIRQQQTSLRASMERLNKYSRYGISEEDSLNLAQIVTRDAARISQLSGMPGQDMTLNNAMSALARHLQMNTDQLKEMTGELQRSGVGARDLARIGSMIGGPGNNIGISYADQARYFANVGQQSRAAGFTFQGTVGAAYGLASGLVEDVRSGTYRQDALFRFGGDTPDEAALRVAQYQLGQSQAYARRTAGSMGVLNALGAPISGSPVAFGSRVGAAYLSNPFAGLEAAQSRTGLTRSSATAFSDAFIRASETVNALGFGGDALGAQLFGNAVGEPDSVIAREEFDRLSARLDQYGGNTDLLRLEGYLRSLGLDADPDQVRQIFGKVGENASPLELRAAYEEVTGALRAGLTSRIKSGDIEMAELLTIAQVSGIFNESDSFGTRFNESRATYALDRKNSSPGDIADLLLNGPYSGSGSVSAKTLQDVFGSAPSDEMLRDLANISAMGGSSYSIRELRSLLNQGSTKMLTGFNTGSEMERLQRAMVMQMVAPLNLGNAPAPTGSESDPLFVRIKSWGD